MSMLRADFGQSSSLNRLYCPEFELPLEYSGYKERVGIDRLALWAASGLESQTLRLHQ